MADEQKQPEEQITPAEETPVKNDGGTDQGPVVIKKTITLKKSPADIMDDLRKMTTVSVSEAQLQRLKDATYQLGNIITEAITQALSDEAKAFKAAAVDLITAANSIIEIPEETRAFFDIVDKTLGHIPNWDDLIAAELEKPQYQEFTFGELAKAGIDKDGNVIPGGPVDQLIKAVLQAAKEGKRVTVKRAHNIEYPIDKPNSILWNLLEKDTEGQISFNMAKHGSKQVIPAYYAIDFDGLENDIQITKRLLPFDKRVYIAISALFNAGNNVITLSQIYYAMGYTGRPGRTDLTRINDAVTKMTTARIFFDNEQEAKKYKYERFKYDGSLLPLESGTAVINGQLADAAIHIFREPPLITFAKQRNQITTVNVKLLQSPVSKTDANLLIDDYLIERISKAKNGKGHSCRILFKTLYNHAGIPDKPGTNTERQQKKRAPAKIQKYLTHYQKEGFIARFIMETDGITVYW